MKERLMVMMFAVVVGVTASGCGVIEGIFKAGIWIGIIIVVVIVLIIGMVVRKVRK